MTELNQYTITMLEDDEIVHFINRQLANLFNFYGCIFTKEHDRIINKATVTFVDYYGHKLLLTAKHVVDYFNTCNNVYLSVFPSNSFYKVMRREAFFPRLLKINPRDRIWNSQFMDISILDAPNELLSLNVCWFSIHNCIDVTKKLRKCWKEFHEHPDEIYNPSFVLGFPNFGHVVREKEQIEYLSSSPTGIFIEQMDGINWEPNLGVSPQLIRLKCFSYNHGKPVLEKNFVDILINDNYSAIKELGKEIMGGYSGGPAIITSTDGNYLFGIITDGRDLFDTGTPYLFAYGLDDIFEEYSSNKIIYGA